MNLSHKKRAKRDQGRKAARPHQENFTGFRRGKKRDRGTGSRTTKTKKAKNLGRAQIRKTTPKKKKGGGETPSKPNPGSSSSASKDSGKGVKMRQGGGEKYNKCLAPDALRKGADVPALMAIPKGGRGIGAGQRGLYIKRRDRKKRKRAVSEGLLSQHPCQIGKWEGLFLGWFVKNRQKLTEAKEKKQRERPGP